jgi:hypothetical protein
VVRYSPDSVTPFGVEAKRRLAEEYDAAQERDEVRKHGERGKEIPDENLFLKPTGETSASALRPSTRAG